MRMRTTSEEDVDGSLNQTLHHRICKRSNVIIKSRLIKDIYHVYM